MAKARNETKYYRPNRLVSFYQWRDASHTNITLVDFTQIENGKAFIRGRADRRLGLANGGLDPDYRAEKGGMSEESLGQI